MRKNVFKTGKAGRVLPILCLFAFIMAGCSSIQFLEQDTVDGPKQIRQGATLNPRDITVYGVDDKGNRKLVTLRANNITFDSSNPGNQTVRIRVSGQEATFQIQVMPLRSLTITSQPTTTTFKQGQDANARWPGLQVRGEWDQLGGDAIDLARTQISGFNKDQAGRQTVRVTYLGQSATFNVNVVAMTAIQIEQAPTKVDYMPGETLSLTGLRVVGVWEGFPPEALPVTAADVTGFNANNPGVQTLTVTKSGLRATFPVEVLRLASIEMTRQPTKTTYGIGQQLDLAGIQVYGNFTGSTPEKARRVLIPQAQLTASGYNPNLVQEQRVTITYAGMTDTFRVTVQTGPYIADPITSTQEWNNALAFIRQEGPGTEASRKEYTLNIGGNFEIPGVPAPTATTGMGTIQYITVTLRGSGRLTLSSGGSVLYVYTNQTVIIDGAGLTFQGRNNNISAIFGVGGGSGRLELRNGTLTGNTRTDSSLNTSSGVVVSNGTFIMSGGTITGNSCSAGSNRGGGVYSAGTFTMTGRTISNNSTSAPYCAGGVFNAAGTFTMSGGTISNNSAGGNYGGGGVMFFSSGVTFNMTGGTITGNTGSGDFSGGGVYFSFGNFTKTGGAITGNTGTGGNAVFLHSYTNPLIRNANLAANNNLSTADTTTGWGQ